ncbi:hypothetical protein ZWY2020_024017 [Hordeum vulgare]|nr:hypothetical protein ZWY2020_024017 [Hordeum vulgare]
MIDWGETHGQYVQERKEWKTRKYVKRKVTDYDDYEDHMGWYDDGIKHHLHVRPKWTTADAKSLYDDGSDNEAYHDNIREIQGGFGETSSTNVTSSWACFGCASSTDTYARAAPMRSLVSSSHVASSFRVVEEDEEEEGKDEEDKEEDGEE